MKDHLAESTKSTAVKRVLNEALDILISVGIPAATEPIRRRERMAACMMAWRGSRRSGAKPRAPRTAGT